MKPAMLQQVKRSLRELIKMETDSAQIHYSRYNRKTRAYDFSDDLWRRSHEHSWRVVKRARDLLARL